jgi:hypothetical protein
MIQDEELAEMRAKVLGLFKDELWPRRCGRHNGRNGGKRTSRTCRLE